jgi:uncharacterized lipoprotein YbaY
VVAEQRIELKGRQVPVPFELTVDRAKLVAGKQYSVRGAFFSGARPTWFQSRWWWTLNRSRSISAR